MGLHGSSLLSSVQSMMGFWACILVFYLNECRRRAEWWAWMDHNFYFRSNHHHDGFVLLWACTRIVWAIRPAEKSQGRLYFGWVRREACRKKNMGCKWAKNWKWYKFGRNICRSSQIFWKIAKLKVKLWAKSLEISTTNSISFERYENGNLQGANTIHEKDNHHQSLPFPFCCTLHAVDCIIMVLVDELKRSQDWSPA